MVAEPRAWALPEHPVCARPQSVVMPTINAVPQAGLRLSAGTHPLIAAPTQAATIAPIAQARAQTAAHPTAAVHRIAVAAVVVPLAAAALVAAEEAVPEVVAVAT